MTTGALSANPSAFKVALSSETKTRKKNEEGLMESRSTQAIEAHAGFQTEFQSTVESSESVNPCVWPNTSRAHRFPDTVRVQESWLAAGEKRALLWLAARIPHRIGPDHLTVFGFA